MNVAFGPEDAVYTAEDDTGRIKRYSADGKLLGLVGSVELKPGCKNCSISVGKDGAVWEHGVVRSFKHFRSQRLALICKTFEKEAGIKLFRKG